MAISAGVTIRGTRALRNRLQKIRNMDKTLLQDGEVEALMLKRTIDRFKRKIDPDGNRWQNLVKSPGFKKTRKNPANNLSRRYIMNDTGALQRSIGRVKLGQFATGFGFRIGVTDRGQLAKARALTSGEGRSNLTGRPIPARRFLGISRQDITAIERLLQRKAREATRR